jgi:hypothetical protein
LRGLAKPSPPLRAAIVAGGVVLYVVSGAADEAASVHLLAELRRLGGFDQAKLLGTFDVTPEGRHYTG